MKKAIVSYEGNEFYLDGEVDDRLLDLNDFLKRQRIKIISLDGKVRGSVTISSLKKVTPP